MKSRVVLVEGRGGPEVLHVVEREAPAAGRGEVRIAVEVAGVAYGDVVRRRGVMAPGRPFTPGYDVVGKIDALGEGADPALLGRRAGVLMPRVGFGGYADHVCVPAERLVLVPDGVEPDAAVCLGLNYITAHQLVARVARLRAGQRMLVHGAAGGVGSALLDVGRQRGLVMFGTASAGKQDFVREHGAEPIDYRAQDFVARIAELTAKPSGDAGVDAVFDGIGGAHLKRSHKTLAPGGTLVWFGISGDLERGLRGMLANAAAFVGLKLRPDGKRVRFYGITVTPGSGWRHCRDDWAELLAQHARGELHPVIGARVPLAEVRRAHELIDGAKVLGKIVLTAGA